MVTDMQGLSPPPSLPIISPPPQSYSPPNPLTLLEFFHNLLQLALHALLVSFSTQLVPVHPYGVDIYPPAPTAAVAVVPTRKERRGASKSPSASPSSMTLTEGTLLDGEELTARKLTERGGFEVSRVRIRPGNGKGGITSRHEAWAKVAFGMWWSVLECKSSGV